MNKYAAKKTIQPVSASPKKRRGAAGQNATMQPQHSRPLSASRAERSAMATAYVNNNRTWTAAQPPSANPKFVP